MEDCYFQPHLDDLIVDSLELDRSDEGFRLYDEILDRRSKKIQASSKSIMKQAMKVYHELVELRQSERLNKNPSKAS